MAKVRIPVRVRTADAAPRSPPEREVERRSTGPSAAPPVDERLADQRLEDQLLANQRLPRQRREGVGANAGAEGEVRAPALAPSEEQVPSPDRPEDAASGLLPENEVGGQVGLAVQAELRASQERMLSDMVSVADNLDRALDAAQDDSPLRQGVALTRDELLRRLSRYDVERVEALGASFDPYIHEAVSVAPAFEFGVEPGTVVQVIESGYRWAEKLLRPARVVVAA